MSVSNRTHDHFNHCCWFACFHRSASHGHFNHMSISFVCTSLFCVLVVLFLSVLILIISLSLSLALVRRAVHQGPGGSSCDRLVRRRRPGRTTEWVASDQEVPRHCVRREEIQRPVSGSRHCTVAPGQVRRLHCSFRNREAIEYLFRYDPSFPTCILWQPC